MNTRHLIVRSSVLGVTVLGVWQLLVSPSPASAGSSKQATAIMSIPALAAKRGPTPPTGSTFVGVQSQPMVGELKLPIQNVGVYQFDAKGPAGRVVPVNWAYSPGAGTYLWGSTKIQCANSTAIEKGSFAAEVHDDGSGAYALGTKKCPVAQIYGCHFDATGNETGCGICAWNQSELTCVAN
jgi:hypothetical protein